MNFRNLKALLYASRGGFSRVFLMMKYTRTVRHRGPSEVFVLRSLAIADNYATLTIQGEALPPNVHPKAQEFPPCSPWKVPAGCGAMNRGPRYGPSTPRR